MVPDWLITNHVTKITSSDWLFTCLARFLTVFLPLAEKKAPPITTADMSTDQSSQMATLAATAAWRLSRWNDLEKYTGELSVPNGP